MIAELIETFGDATLVEDDPEYEGLDGDYTKLWWFFTPTGQQIKDFSSVQMAEFRQKTCPEEYLYFGEQDREFDDLRSNCGVVASARIFKSESNELLVGAYSIDIFDYQTFLDAAVSTWEMLQDLEQDVENEEQTRRQNERDNAPEFSIN